MAIGPVVSLVPRSTTGYYLISLRDEERMRVVMIAMCWHTSGVRFLHGHGSGGGARRHHRILGVLWLAPWQGCQEAARSVNRSAGLLLGVFLALFLGGFFHAFAKQAQVTAHTNGGVAGGQYDRAYDSSGKQGDAFHEGIL